MESLRRVDLSYLAPGTVILVETSDGKSYKLILFKDDKDFGIGNVMMSEDSDLDEIEADRVVISKLQVGKPIAIVTAPKNEYVRGALDMRTLQTAEVTSIEVYS